MAQGKGVCSNCNKKIGLLSVEKMHEFEDGSLLCDSCYLDLFKCVICGKVPESEDKITGSYYRIDGKYYCYEDAQPIVKQKLNEFILTMTPNIEDYRIVEYLGIDSVEIVIGTGLFSEFSGEVSDAFGLRSAGFESKLGEAKKQAIEALKVKAIEKDANAIVAADLDYTEFSGNRVGLILSGTLVKVKKL